MRGKRPPPRSRGSRPGGKPVAGDRRARRGAQNEPPTPPAPPLPRGPLHLAVLYGEPFEPFVAPIVADLAGGAAGLGHELAAVSVERAAAEPAHCARVDRLYVLPFDLPAHVELPAAAFVRQLFPRAEVLNSMEAHELCWDRVRTDRRLVARGVPVPESLYTESPDEVRAFVAEHQFAILKERRSCGGQGHVVLCDAHEALAGEAGSRRFVVELGGDAAAARKLRDGVLIYPPPFFVQRLVGERGPRDRFTPGRILRAYVLAGRVAFWTERYRDRYRRPADWIVNVSLGARYRFVLETSEELRKLALRAASAVGMQVGVIDIVRSAGGPFVLEADTDGQHMYIDRQFKQIPDYRLAFDLDRLIAAALADEEIPALAAPV